MKNVWNALMAAAFVWGFLTLWRAEGLYYTTAYTLILNAIIFAIVFFGWKGWDWLNERWIETRGKKLRCMTKTKHKAHQVEVVAWCPTHMENEYVGTFWCNGKELTDA